MRGIHRWPVNSPHKWPVTRNIFFHLMTSSCMKTCVPEQTSRAGTSNYFRQILWGGITCPCTWYLYAFAKAWGKWTVPHIWPVGVLRYISRLIKIFGIINICLWWLTGKVSLIRHIPCTMGIRHGLEWPAIGITLKIYLHGKMRMKTWWHHQMETFSALLDLGEGNPLVTGGFPSQRPVTRSFGVFFD